MEHVDEQAVLLHGDFYLPDALLDVAGFRDVRNNVYGFQGKQERAYLSWSTCFIATMLFPKLF